MKTISHNNISWIDIHNPQEKDLHDLKEKYNLHPIIKKQFLPPVHRPKIEEFTDQTFMVLHFPVYNKKNKQTKPVEVDFIITAEALITSHSEEIPSLDIFFNDCQVQEYHKSQHFKNSGFLLFGLLDFMIDECLPMLDHISENIDHVESEVFKQGKEKEMLNEITNIKRDLIDFRRAIKPQRSVLEILAKKGHRLYGPQIDSIAQEVLGSNIRVWNVLENHKELISSIEQTNDSLLSYKLSDIMKFLTIISFITFPLTIFTGFFGMNVFESVSAINQNPHAWWIIMTGMIVLATLMYAYFKKKKWL